MVKSKPGLKHGLQHFERNLSFHVESFFSFKLFDSSLLIRDILSVSLLHLLPALPKAVGRGIVTLVLFVSGFRRNLRVNRDLLETCRSSYQKPSVTLSM